MIQIILFFGLILRLINLDQSLWLDEAISTTFAKSYSLFDFVTRYTVADFHPPGYFLIIWFWGRIGNFSEIWMRIPSVIFGVLTVYLVYQTGRVVKSKKVGLIAALLLAVNPLHIYYSQEARMYSFAALAVSLNVYLFLKFLRGNKIKWYLAVFSGFLVLTSDYLAYLIFPAEILVLIFEKDFTKLKKWTIYITTSTLGLIFWIPLLILQFKTGLVALLQLPAWKSVVGEVGFKSFTLTFIKFVIGRVSFSDKLIYFLSLIPIGLLISCFVWQAWKYEKQKVIRLLELLLIPLILAQLISIAIPIYSYFRVLYLLPVFILIISLGVSPFAQVSKILVSLMVFIGIFYSLIYFTDPSFQREDWKGVVGFLKQKKDTVVLMESSNSFLPFDYYSSNRLTTAKLVLGLGALKNMPAKNDSDVKNLAFLANGRKEIYLIDYLVEIADPKRTVRRQLEKIGYKNTDTKNFNGVGFVYHYVKE